jgi:hypothetical protein
MSNTQQTEGGMMEVQNTLTVGDKVDYNGKIATVIDFAKPFMGYPAVVIEFKALFADFGPNYLQIDRRSVLEYGLKPIK